MEECGRAWGDQGEEDKALNVREMECNSSQVE